MGDALTLHAKEVAEEMETKAVEVGQVGSEKLPVGVALERWVFVFFLGKELLLGKVAKKSKEGADKQADCLEVEVCFGGGGTENFVFGSVLLFREILEILF